MGCATKVCREVLLRNTVSPLAFANISGSQNALRDRGLKEGGGSKGLRTSDLVSQSAVRTDRQATPITPILSYSSPLFSPSAQLILPPGGVGKGEQQEAEAKEEGEGLLLRSAVFKTSIEREPKGIGHFYF